MTDVSAYVLLEDGTRFDGEACGADGHAVGSRNDIDYECGLERMVQAGAVVTTVEAALFELLERAGTPEFKAVQKLIL